PSVALPVKNAAHPDMETPSPPTGPTREGSPSPIAPSPVHPPDPVYRPASLYQSVIPPQPPKLSSSDERLIAAYERELQAIASPTSIQSDNGSNPFQSPNNVSVPSAGNASAVNALANALGRANDNRNTPERPVVTANRESDEENLQSWKEAFLA